jgi:hypothetical protein
VQDYLLSWMKSAPFALSLPRLQKFGPEHTAAEFLITRLQSGFRAFCLEWEGTGNQELISLLQGSGVSILCFIIATHLFVSIHHTLSGISRTMTYADLNLHHISISLSFDSQTVIQVKSWREENHAAREAKGTHPQGLEGGRIRNAAPKRRDSNDRI